MACTPTPQPKETMASTSAAGSGQVLDELVLALALDGDLGQLQGLALQLARHADGVGGDAHLALAAGQAHRHAGAAAGEQHLLVPGDEVSSTR